MKFFFAIVWVFYIKDTVCVLRIIGNFVPCRQDKKCSAANSKNVAADAAPHISLQRNSCFGLWKVAWSIRGSWANQICIIVNLGDLYMRTRKLRFLANISNSVDLNGEYWAYEQCLLSVRFISMLLAMKLDGV